MYAAIKKHLANRLPLLVWLILLWMVCIPATLYGQCVTNIDFNEWGAEGGPSNWVINPLGDSVNQTINGQPTFFISRDTFMNVDITGQFQVDTTWDNDFVGFVFSYSAPLGSPNDSMEFWLFDWKQSDQGIGGGTSFEGFTLNKVSGTIPYTGANMNPTFWLHQDTLGFDNRATAYSTTSGWSDHTIYDFNLNLTPTRAVIKIDGDTIFDYSDCFEPGHFGFYNFSQGNVNYMGFNYSLQVNFDMKTEDVCFGDTAEFTFVDSTCSIASFSNITNVLWDFGDGNSSTLTNPTHYYTAPGQYDVKLVVTDAQGCTDSITQEIRVVDPTIAGFIPPSGCANSPLAFVDTSYLYPPSPHSWLWDFGDGDTSTLQNPTHVYGTPGSYSVKLVATAGLNCSDSVSHVVDAQTYPDVDFGLADVCEGDTVFFTDSTTQPNNYPLTSYAWDVDNDGATEYTSTDASHLYPDSGTYEVSLIVGDSQGCSDTLAQQVVVYPIPEASFTTGSVCLGDSVTFTNTSETYFATPESWAWNFGDSSTDSINENPVYLYADTGNFAVVMTHVASGCADTTDTSWVRVSPLPVADLVATTACLNDSVFLTDSSTLAVGSILSWAWDFGDGTTFTGQTPGAHLYANDSTFAIELAVVSDSGCVDTVIKNVAVKPLPVADFTFQNVCAGSTLTLTNGSTPPPSQSIALVEWDVDGDGNYDLSGLSVSPVMNDSGSFPITMRVTDGAGCQDSITKTVLVHHVPEPQFKLDSVCLGDSILFEDTTETSGVSIAQWWWDFGDGAPNANSSATFHTYANADTFTVTFAIVTDSGCTDTNSMVQAVVYPLPVVGFSAPAVCDNDSMAFTDTSSVSVGTLSSWSWDFGDNNSFPLQNPKHLYAQDSTWNVSLTVTSSFQCVDSASQAVTVYALPEPDFSAPNTCEGFLIAFADSSIAQNGVGLASWDWDFDADDLADSTGAQTTHLFPDSGNYTVELLVSDSLGCSDSLAKTVRVHPQPLANFTMADVCDEDSASFTDQSTGYTDGLVSWNWDFGDGNTNTSDQNPKHLFAQADTFFVTLTVESDSGCFDTSAAVPIIIHALPQAGFAASSVCLNDSTSFTDTSSSTSGSITNWNWTFGDGSSSTNQHPIYLYAHDSTYLVSLQVTTQFQCSDSISDSVIVYGLPLVNFTAPNTCEGLVTSFTDQSTGVNGAPLTAWIWDVTNDGIGEYSGDTASHMYPDSGNYQVELWVSDSLGCADSLVQILRIHPAPVAAFSVGNECHQDTVSFTDQSTAYTDTLVSWSWYFGDGQSGTAQHPEHLYPAADTFSASLIVTSNQGCVETSDTVQVVTYPLPLAGFSAANVCLNDSVFFLDSSSSALGSIVSYDWLFGDGQIGSGDTLPHLYAQDTTFSVTLSIETNLGCRDSVTQQVRVYELPQPDFISFNVCELDTFTLQGTASTPNLSPIVSWDWDLENDGTTDLSGATINTIYPATGTPTIELLVTDSLGCQDSITHALIINPKPEPGFDFDNVCLTAPVLFGDTSSIESGNMVSWLWDFGDSSALDSAQNPSHLYNNPGSYDITFTVTSDSGCVGVISGLVQIVVNPLPTTNFGAANVCFGDSMVFVDSSSILSGNIAQWEWDFGDGSPPSMQQNPTHLYNDSTTFTVTLITTSDSGCATAATQTVEVYHLPNAGFTALPVCLDDTTSFVDLSTSVSGAITDWQWTFGDGQSDTLSNPLHLYAQPDTVQAQLIVTTNFGCVDSVENNVHIYALPIPDFLTPNTCQTFASPFTDQSQSVNTSSLQSWQWDLNNNDTVDFTTQNASQVFADSGNYAIQLIVTDALGCRDSIVKSTRVHPKPVPGFWANPQCLNDTTVFVDTSTAFTDNLVHWEWDFGDGSPIDFSPSPTHVFPSPDTFPINLTVISDSGCAATLPQVIQVVVWPLPDIGFDLEDVCLNDSTAFADTSTSPLGGIVAWNWDFGDGAVDSVANPIHLYNASGVYSVTLTATSDTGCFDTLTQQIEVFALPAINFQLVDVCEDIPTIFVDSSTSPNGSPLETWLWDVFANDTIDSLPPNLQYTFANAGTFPIELRVIDSLGCTDSLTQNIQIFPRPAQHFGFDSVCAGVNTTFTDSTSISTGSVTFWQWDFGDGSPVSNLQNPQHTYGSAGTYSVSLHVLSDQGCAGTNLQPQTVTVHATPVVDFSVQAVCAGNPITISDNSSVADGTLTSWSWNFGDGSPAVSAQSPSHLYGGYGFYPLQLTVESEHGCVASGMQQAEVYPLPDILFPITSTCFPEPMTFANLTTIPLGDVVSWNWDFGDGQTATDSVPTHAYSNTGTYQVKLIAESDRQCVDSLSQDAYVFVLPVAGFSYEQGCENEPIAFSGTATVSEGYIEEWLWDFGYASATDTVVNPVHQFPLDSADTVRLVVITNQGCIDSVSQAISLLPTPLPDFTSTNDSGCAPLTVNFEAGGQFAGPEALIYAWDFGDGTTGSGSVVNHQYYQVDDGPFAPYSVALRATALNGCTEVIQIDSAVKVRPAAEASFFADPSQTSILDPGIRLIDESFAVNDLWWDFGDGSSDSLLSNPFHVYEQPGSYVVRLNIENLFGCADSASVPIIITNETSVYIPNAFTPNGDGLNDELFVGLGGLGGDFEFRIYDRWGSLVFSATSPAQGWNGLLKSGTRAQQGVYVYQLSFLDFRGALQEKTGTVTLIRSE